MIPSNLSQGSNFMLEKAAANIVRRASHYNLMAASIQLTLCSSVHHKILLLRRNLGYAEKPSANGDIRLVDQSGYTQFQGHEVV
jgi:hypothetical protein